MYSLAWIPSTVFRAYKEPCGMTLDTDQAFIWEFPKIGGYLIVGVLIRRMLLFSVLY